MKDFNDFMDTMNSKDVSYIVEEIKDMMGDNPVKAIVYANTLILREYHDWLHREEQD